MSPVDLSKSKVENEQEYEYYLAESKKSFTRNFQDKGEKLRTRLSEFNLLYSLGSGAFGKVVLVKHRKTEQFFAMKILKKVHLVKSKQIDHTLSEKKILMLCAHPFLMTMDYFTLDNSNVYFILPYLSGGDLYGQLNRERRFDETTAKFYAAQVYLGLEYLHYLDIVYRDLKPENIMIDHHGYIKLTDFGFCKMIKGRTYTICGTPEYIAPELVLMKGYGFSADWWSFGILLFELTAGYPPFRDTGDHVKLYSTIVSGKYRMHSSFTKELKDLINNILQVEPSRRIGCLKRGSKEIKNHPWFSDLPWIHLINRKIVPPLKAVVENPDDVLRENREQLEKLSIESTIDRFAREFMNF